MHLTGDFPDPVDFFKTRVIERFLDLTSASFDHSVFSINRISPSSRELARQLIFGGTCDIRTVPFAYGTALTYQAPAKGVLHKTRLLQLGRWWAQHIVELSLKPDLLVGHKLTLEGIAVYEAAKLLDIPFALTIQSHTDDKILRARPDLESLFAKIYHSASQVIVFSPIAQIKIEKRLGKRREPAHIIPCPTDLDAPLRPNPSGSSLVSVFHLKNQRIKNLKGMLEGLHIANKCGAGLTLNVVGGGEEKDFDACRSLAKFNPNAKLEGPLDRYGVQKRMNEAIAFIMPSLGESFGLVFIEALFAGLPIIYPKEQAIDGYFDNHDFAIPVDPRDSKEIAQAMIYVRKNETALKNALSQWQKSDQAKLFARPSISEAYCNAMNAAVACEF